VRRPQNRRPRVVFVNRFYFPDESATSQLLSDLTDALASDGIEIHVVTSRLLYGGTGRSLPARESRGDIKVHRVWTTAFGRFSRGRIFDYLTFHAACFLCLARVARRDDVVVAKTDPPLLSVTAFAAAMLKRSRLVNWLQDLFPEVAERLAGNGRVSRALAPLKWVRNLSLRHADENVVIGDRMRDVLVNDARVPPAKVSVVHNWIDGTVIMPMQRHENPLRKEWALGDRFVVGYAGNLGRVHALDALIETAFIVKDDPDIVFVLIGEGYQRQRLEAECSRRGLFNILFKPYLPRERLRSGLTLPDVHLVSLSPAMEGLVVPSKIYGAMAAGVPVVFIGDNDGEVAKMLQEQPAAGYVVGVDAADHLASVITHLARTPADRASMGAAARQRFTSRFDRSIAIASWKRALSQLG
jgi:colanic acid biosynthesis glycosyl transferase WcaI